MTFNSRRAPMNRAIAVQQKAAWLGHTSDAIVALEPMLAGRLDWDTLRFMYDSGRYTPAAAAHRYVELHAQGATARVVGVV